MWTKLFSRSEINYALSNTLCPYFIIIFKIKLHHLICYKTQSVPELSAVQKYNSPVAHRVSQLVRIKTARYWTVFLLIFNILFSQIAVLLHVFIRHIWPLISSFFWGCILQHVFCILRYCQVKGIHLWKSISRMLLCLSFLPETQVSQRSSRCHATASISRSGHHKTTKEPVWHVTLAVLELCVSSA